MSERSRKISAWVASVVALALVGGAAWLLVRLFWPAQQKMTTVIVDDARPIGPGGRERMRAPEAPAWFRAAAQRWSDADAPEGVRQLLGTHWRVKSANFIVEVDQREEQFEFAFRYLAPDFATPEMRTAVAIAREARNRRPRAIPDLTPEQHEKLRALKVPEGAVVSPTDRQQAEALWKAYAAADEAGRPAAEKNLVAGVAKIAASSREATRQAYLSFAGQVSSILTAPQIQAFSKTRPNSR